MSLPSFLRPVCVGLAGAVAATAVLPAQAPMSSAQRSQAAAMLEQTSTAFVANAGQWDARVRYAARFRGMRVLLQRDGWSVVVGEARDRAAVRFRFPEGSGGAELVAERPLEGRFGYFLGDDPQRWRTEVPGCESVLYRRAAAGIDVRVRAEAGSFKYDAVVAPEADLDGFVIRVEGAQGLRLDEDGALRIETAAGPIVQPPTVTFEGAQAVPCRYRLVGPDAFGFAAAGWTRRRPLVIDPRLLYSTYFGGSGSDGVLGLHLRGDVVTVVGANGSGDFPTTPGAFRATPSGNGDLFVARFDLSRTGSAQLVFATYLGGNDRDHTGATLTVEIGGSVVVGGRTRSTNFPTTANAFRRGPGGLDDGFVTRLDPSRTGPEQLAYSTYLGGGNPDWVSGVAAAADGRIVIAGYTGSDGMPTTPGAYQTARAPGGFGDGYVAILDPSQPPSAQLAYGTYLGGRHDDWAERVLLLDDGKLVVAGETESADLNPTPGAFQPRGGGGTGHTDAFVAILDPTQSGLAQRVYLTYLGGSGASENEWVYEVARLRSGVLALAGGTRAAHFPTSQGAFDRTFGGSTLYDFDGFLTLLDPSRVGTEQLVYSTFLGGSGSEICLGMHMENSGVATLAGETWSPLFPTTPDAPYPYFLGDVDAFVVQLDVVRSRLLFGSYLGGTGPEGAFGVAVDDLGRVVVGGATVSSDFPVTPDAYSTVSRGANEGFLARLDTLPTGVELFGGPSPGCSGAVLVWATGIPYVGAFDFGLLCGRAPDNGAGVVVLSAARLATPLRFADVDVWVDPGQAAFMAAGSTPSGRAEIPLPIPSDKTLTGRRFYAQTVWIEPAGPPPCPPQRLSASPAFEIVVQR
jgi:hypothetical protein